MMSVFVCVSLLLIGVCSAGTFSGYDVVSQRNTPNGIVLYLAAQHGNLDTHYGPAIASPKVTIVLQTADRVHIKITDANSTRYEVPEHLVPRPQDPAQTPAALNYNISIATSPFAIKVTRLRDGHVVFAGSKLLFTDQLWTLESSFDSSYAFYGLGEQTRKSALRLQPGTTFTLWNRDCAAALTDVNLYGSHPFYLGRDGPAAYHGVFLLSSNGMDIIYAKDGQSFTYHVIGGIPDFYVFTGPSAREVISQYTEVIGRPRMIPLWSLGFHQCRWGYKSVEELEQVVANYSAAGIPLQVMWSDIDYMDSYRDFTLDPVNYPVDKMNKFVTGLHANGQQYVLIVDPGISNTDPSYGPYIRGTQANVWIRDASQKPLVGKVWPGLVNFPDFQMHPNASAYWQTEIGIFHQQLPFDGLWIDMNEISNFCDGECTSTQLTDGRSAPTAEWTVSARRNRVRVINDEIPSSNVAESGPRGFNPNNPPYKIHNCGGLLPCPLNHHTISTDALHFPFSSTSTSVEYNVHNLFGLSEAKATQQGLENLTNKRAFVISRSSFPGSGTHTGHWTGDNASSWPDLQYSIRGILNFNMFGITMIGADICGFTGATTEEMCARWIALGSFYTFTRNHNQKGMPSQELYLWESVTKVSIKVLRNRYTLSPYYYTAMAWAHRTGDPVLRPVFFNFPDQDSALLNLDTQFFVGDALMVAPVLTKGATSVQVTFPKARWYDWWSYSELTSTFPAVITVPAALDEIPVFLRGGNILACQHYATGSIVRNDTMYLVVALDESMGAQGHVYFDDHEAVATSQNTTVAFTMLQTGSGSSAVFSLTSQIEHNAYPIPAAIVDSVFVMGLVAQPRQVLLNGNDITGNTKWTASNHLLSVSGVTIPLAEEFKLTILQ